MFRFTQYLSIVLALTILPLVSEARYADPRAYLVGNLETGWVVFSRDSYRKLPIASLVKLFTAMLAFKYTPVSSTIAVSEDILKTEGDSGGLWLNEAWSRDELLSALLMESSNDAAVALMRQLGGEEVFRKLVSTELQKLNFKTTSIIDPAGLSPKNVSSARELFRLAKHIYKEQPEIFELSKVHRKVVRPENRTFDHILTSFNGYDNLSAFLGGKLGYLPEAKQTYLGVFKINDRPFVVIVLGARDRFRATNDLIKRTTSLYHATLNIPNLCKDNALLIDTEKDGICVKSPLSEEDHIEINLSSYKVRLYENGLLLAEYWLSGKPKIDSPYRVPSGEFRIVEKYDETVDERGIYWPKKISFDKGWMSGLPLVKGALRDLDHIIIGSREHNERDVDQIYSFAKIGMPLIIYE